MVQRLECNLAKVETGFRLPSLAPLRELLTPRVSFILQKYPISLVDMGFFHVWKEDLQMKITIESLEIPLCIKKTYEDT